MSEKSVVIHESYVRIPIWADNIRYCSGCDCDMEFSWNRIRYTPNFGSAEGTSCWTSVMTCKGCGKPAHKDSVSDEFRSFTND